MIKKGLITKDFRGLLVVLVLMLSLYIGSSIYNNYVNKKIQDEKIVTFGKIIKIESGAKNLSIKYKFKLNNVDHNGGLPIDNYPKIDLVDRFFQIHVSKSNPEFNKIFLDREITDSIAIIKAGFSFNKKIIRNQFQD